MSAFLPEPSFRHDSPARLGVLLINLGDQPYIVRGGDRIAQMIVAPVARWMAVFRRRLPPPGLPAGFCRRSCRWKGDDCRTP